jgi:hypothetical protein
MKVENLKEITVKEIAHKPAYFVPGKISTLYLFFFLTSLSLSLSLWVPYEIEWRRFNACMGFAEGVPHKAGTHGCCDQ